MMKTNWLVAMFIACCFGKGFAQQPAPIKVNEGLLQGMYEDGLTVYKGVPFATPPVVRPSLLKSGMVSNRLQSLLLPLCRAAILLRERARIACI